MKKSIGISVFLIVIGVVFLLDNLEIIDISISELIRDYWPVILIWMGIEKLFREDIVTCRRFCKLAQPEQVESCVVCCCIFSRQK